MSPYRKAVLDALVQERDDSTLGLGGEVVAVDWENEYLLLTVRPKAGRTKLKLDEQLEGALAKWGDGLASVAIIKMVDTDNDRLVVSMIAGSQPKPNDSIWIFPEDFLTPLCNLWSGDAGKVALSRYNRTKTELAPLHAIKPLPDAFGGLRKRQAEAMECFAYRSATLFGPPGTGKSYTVGALVAYILTNYSKARILIAGPTNVAVDGALIAVDDWLQRLDRQDLAERTKRLGAYFNPSKFQDRPHLLAPEVAKAVEEYLLLEALEPPRSNIAEHVKWKGRMDAARAALASDIAETSSNSRVVATTVATAAKWKEALQDGQVWHFVICDEASQVLGPAALMLASMGQQVIFAGDPNQLAPIVQSANTSVKARLGKTAFDLYEHAHSVQLNEQSRMTDKICHAVGTTFYGGNLKVCAKARSDGGWKQERSPFFVDGREVPRVHFQDVTQPALYSQKYGGFIRFDSAQLVEKVCDELSGSYVAPEDVLVLTPFRAQRALLKSMLKRRHPQIAVSTVHRAQGSERTLVIFDPVDATATMLKGKDGERLVNVAISRAKAHVVIPFHNSDLQNVPLSKIHALSVKWNQPGAYAAPFRF